MKANVLCSYFFVLFSEYYFVLNSCPMHAYFILPFPIDAFMTQWSKNVGIPKSLFPILFIAVKCCDHFHSPLKETQMLFRNPLCYGFGKQIFSLFVLVNQISSVLVTSDKHEWLTSWFLVFFLSIFFFRWIFGAFHLICIYTC